MDIDLKDNRKIYVVKSGELKAVNLPEFGRVTITVQDGKVERIITEESKFV